MLTLIRKSVLLRSMILNTLINSIYKGVNFKARIVKTVNNLYLVKKSLLMDF